MARKAATLASLNPPTTNDDPVFFGKEAIRIGTQLVSYGRRDPMSIWRVAKIETYRKLPSGNYRTDPVASVQHLDDLITLIRFGTDPGKPSRRQPTFGYLSYSAIWRIR